MNRQAKSRILQHLRHACLLLALIACGLSAAATQPGETSQKGGQTSQKGGQASQKGEQAADTLPTDSLMARGRRYFEQREASKALQCFQTVSERYKNDDSIGNIRLAIRALNNCACVYKYFFFDYIKAYDYFTKAYQLCEKAGDEEFLPVIMVNLGDLLNDYGVSYSSQTMSQQAQEMFEKCIERATESQNWELMTTAFFNLSNQNYTLPLERYRAIFATEIPDSTPDLQFVRLQYHGIEQLQAGNYEAARNCFTQQLTAISARWEPERDTLAAYMNIAYTYRMEGNYAHEEEFLQKALQLATASNVSDQATGIRHLLTEARAHELSERQLVQQLALLFIAIMLLLTAGFATLLWRKNRQLHSRNKSLYEQHQQLLQAESEANLLRKEYEDAKYSRSSLSSEQKSNLVFRLQELLSSPDIICEQDFNLGKLAKMADSNTTYVSQVINERFNATFSNLLAGYRIKEACRRMSDKEGHYSHLTIEAIGASVGFKSRTAFINAFKRETGLTPSEYLRMAHAE